MYTPFTYYLYHPATKQHYYGVRYHKGCDPSSLWTTYFTSSKRVNALIEEYGADSFQVSIRKTFTSKEDAIAWEYTVLRRLKVCQKPLWINQTDRPSVNRPSNYIFSSETRQKMSQARKNKVPWNKGIPCPNKSKGTKRGEEQKIRIRIGQKAKPKKPFNRETCTRCIEYWIVRGYTPDQAKAEIQKDSALKWASRVTKKNLHPQ